MLVYARLGSHKSDLLEAELARLALGCRTSEALPTIRELARRYGTSVGSVHAALARLEAAGAVALRRNGRRGTWLERRSVGPLWAIAERGPLVIALPVVSTLRVEGLATALKRQMTAVGIETFLVFMRGSRTRLHALKSHRCHIAVMSAFAARRLADDEVLVAAELPPGTFTTEHRVFFRADRPGAGAARVLVDRDSVDQAALSELEFRDQPVEFVQTSYVGFGRALAEGRGDTLVWTTEEMAPVRPPGVLDRPLSEHVRAEVSDGDRRAALVVRASDIPVLGTLAAALSPAEVVRVQHAVLAGDLIPEY